MESEDEIEEKADVELKNPAPSKLTKRKPKKKLAAKKFSGTGSDSDSDSDDPDFLEVKEKKNGSPGKKRRKSQTWKPPRPTETAFLTTLPPTRPPPL